MKWTWFAVVVIVAATAPLEAQRRRPNRPSPVSLPKGPVRQVILNSCTACHGIDDYAYHALDRAAWKALLETKHKGKEVSISDPDRDLLLDYLAATFGPNSKPFKPPDNRPATDAAIRRILDNVCSTCHSLERVNAARYSEEMWREVVTDMRSKGARLDDKDVETLVEYFAKNQAAN